MIKELKKRIACLLLVSISVFSLQFYFTQEVFAATWTEQTGSGSRNWSGITSSSDGTKLAATVQSGYIYTSTDSGATWTEQTGSGSRNWSGITSSSDGTKLAAAVKRVDDNSSVISDGYIYTSTDSGATWTEQTGSGSHMWNHIKSSPDGTKIVASEFGSDGGSGDLILGYVYTSTDSGVTWTQRTNSGQRRWGGVALSSDGTKMVAVTFNGYIYTSTDSGATWTQQTAAGLRFWNGITSSSDGVKLTATVSGGYIYTSVDSGSTWTQQTSAGSRNWRGVTSSLDGINKAAFVYGGYIYTYYEDTTPPAISSPLPSGAQSEGTTEVILQATTDEDATCKYGTTEDTAYASISNTFSSTGGTTHTQSITGLSAGTYTYYVRCSDGSSNVNTSDIEISFSIPEPTSSGGGTGGTDVDASCSVSETKVKVGEEVDIEIDAEITRRGDDEEYTFKWIKVLTGDDENTSHSFDEPGRYKIQGRVATDRIIEIISCPTIVVSEDDTTSNNDDEEETEEDTPSSSFSEIISKYKSFLTTLYNLGITLPSNVLSMLDIESTPESSSPSYTFTQNLELGDSHPEVKFLQQFLNNNGYTVAETGPGSKGQETEMFGYATQAALIRFQRDNNITPAEGYFGTLTRNKINSL